MDAVLISLLSGLIGAILATVGSAWLQHKRVQDEELRKRAIEVFTPLYNSICEINQALFRSKANELSLDSWNEVKKNYLFLASESAVKNQFNDFFNRVIQYNNFAINSRNNIKNEFVECLYSMGEGIIYLPRGENWENLDSGIYDNLKTNVNGVSFAIQRELITKADSSKNEYNVWVVGQIMFNLFKTHNELTERHFKASDPEFPDKEVHVYVKEHCQKIFDNVLESKSFQEFLKQRNELRKESQELINYLHKRIEEKPIK